MILDCIVFKEIVAKTQKECTQLQRKLLSAEIFEPLDFDFNIFVKEMGSTNFTSNVTVIIPFILTSEKGVQFCAPKLVLI